MPPPDDKMNGRAEPDRPGYYWSGPSVTTASKTPLLRGGTSVKSPVYDFTSLLVVGEHGVDQLNAKYKQGWVHHAQSEMPEGVLVTLKRVKS